MIALKGMNPQQKAKLEQQAVFALAGVFVLVFLMGPARMLFGGRPAARPAASAAPGLGTLPQLMQQRNQLLEAPLKTLEADPPRKPAVLAIGYTAGELRDPMKSLLPVVEKADPRQVAQKTPQPVKPTAPPKPPPKLEIQGLLWGGGAPKAIIAGQLYGVGETVQGVKILSITRTGITIEHESGPVSYAVSKAASKQQRSIVR